MKPPQFEYDDPRDLDEVLSLLERYGDDAKVLAGGQSLIPLLNFRLARPDRLVDINGVAELAYVRRQDGVLRIGAMTRQASLERAPEAAASPLVLQALENVGHLQIRNRGTVGGSIAHADPAAELPVAVAVLDGRLHVRSNAASRVVGWEDFFVTHLTTALEPDELLIEIEIPALAPGTGTAFVEFSRRHGDFALGGAAVTVEQAADGTCRRAAIGLLGAAPTPIRAREAEAGLAGAAIDEGTAREAAAAAVRDICPAGDIHGSGDYRRGLIEALVRRALLAAAARAGGLDGSTEGRSG